MRLAVASWLALICVLSAAAQKTTQAGVPARTIAGLQYCWQGEYDRAMTLLDSALEQATDPGLMQNVGACYLDADHPAKAVAAFEKLVEDKAAPQDQNLVFLARSYLSAAAYFGSRLKKAPGSAEFLSILQNAMQQGSTDARAGFETASRRSPYLRADLTFGEGVQLFATHSQDAALLYVLTVLSGEQAIQCISEAQSRYPDSVSVRCLHADMLAARGRNERARQEYEQIANLPDATVTVYHAAAMFYSKLNDWESALKYFRKERVAAPSDERAEVGISDSLLHLRRFEELRAFLKPLAAERNCNWAPADLARAAQQLGNLNEAVLQLKQAEVCDAQNPSIHYRLARLFEQTGHTAEADRELALFRQSHARTALETTAEKKP